MYAPEGKKRKIGKFVLILSLAMSAVLAVSVAPASDEETPRAKCNRCLIRCALLYDKKFKDCFVSAEVARYGCTEVCAGQNPNHYRISLRFQGFNMCRNDFNDCLVAEPKFPNQEFTCKSKNEDCLRKLKNFD